MGDWVPFRSRPRVHFLFPVSYLRNALRFLISWQRMKLFCSLSESRKDLLVESANRDRPQHWNHQNSGLEIRNPALWNLESRSRNLESYSLVSRIQVQESGILRKRPFGIRNPLRWNLEDCHGLLYMRQINSFFSCILIAGQSLPSTSETSSEKWKCQTIRMRNNLIYQTYTAKIAFKIVWTQTDILTGIQCRRDTFYTFLNLIIRFKMYPGQC